MLFLHEANLRDLKWNGEPLFEASRAELKEVLNGDCQLKVVYPITDSKLFEELVVDKLISSPSPTLGRQFFRIKTITEEDDALEVLCDPISDDIMKRRINPMMVNGTDCQTALNRMVASSRNRLGDFLFESDITTPHIYTSKEEETLYTVLMDGKHSILGTWEGELVRDNRLIAIKGHRGKDRGEVLSTHHNIASYQRVLDASAVYTRVVVKSTFRAEGETEDRYLEVTVDSPLIHHYPYINEVVFENNQLTDIETMKTWAKAKFTHDGIDKVKDSLVIKAYQVDGTTLHLGDTVSIKSQLHKADFKKKVVGYTWDALSKSYIDFTFDDQVVYGRASQSTMNSLASEILHANDYGLSAIQAEIDASNRRFDLKEEKLREAIESEISRAEAKAEEQVAQVNQTISSLQERVKQQSDLSRHHDSVLASHLRQLNENIDLATVAKQEALTAQNLAKTSQMAAATALSRAMEYRHEAIAEASRLDGIQRQAMDSQIAAAKTQAVGEASQLIERAKTLLAQQVSAISTELTTTKNAIKLLATKTEVSEIGSRISNAESSLQVQAGHITSKANKTDVDAVSGRLTRTESSIEQQAREISKRLTSTQVESAITSKGYQTKAQVDSNIAGREYQTKAQVDSNIAGRNLVSATVLDNRVTETVNGYTREISRVERLIPQEIGGNNLLLNSCFDKTTQVTSFTVNNISYNLGAVDWVGYNGGISNPTTSFHAYIADAQGRQSVGVFNESDGTRHWKGFNQSLSSRMPRQQDEFMFSVDCFATGQGTKLFGGIYFYDLSGNRSFHAGFFNLPVKVINQWHRLSIKVTFNHARCDFTKDIRFYLYGYGFSSNSILYVDKLKLEEGTVASGYSLPFEELATAHALQKVESTVDGHSRTFTQLGTLPDTVKWSTIKQTIDRVTTTIGDSTAISKTIQTALVSLQVFKDLQTGLSAQQSLTANHYALKFLKASGDVLTQLNLNTGGVKIQGKLIHLNGQTLIDNGVITSAKIASLDAGKITTGYLSASRIASQAITGDKIKFDQAFFHQMTANEALFKTIFAKSAFITAVQSVTLSANRIVGGLLTATNHAMSINLNQANMTFNSSASIDFNSSSNALKRTVGDVTGFLHFNNATAGGTYVGLGVTSHHEGVKSQDTARFAGVRIFRSNDKVDQTEIYGDTIYLGHAFNGNALKLTATRLNATYEMVDIINAIKALWRCWLHFNNVRWNPADGNFSRAVINEYNSHNIG